MLKNYLVTALRNFKRYKGYTAINILGLTVGLASSLLILMWTRDEVSIDRFHEKKDRLYQVMRNIYLADGNVMTTNAVPQPVMGALLSGYPEVEQAALVSWENEFLFSAEAVAFKERGRYVTPQFLEMFSFPLIAGNPKTALSDLNAIVISENLAIKYFGSAVKALGQTLKVDQTQEFLVTGVFKNSGANSSLRFDWLIPAEEYIKRNDWVENWGNGGFRIILTLKEGADAASFEKKIEQEINRHTHDQSDERLFIQLFGDRYLHANFVNGVNTGGRIEYVNLLNVVAVFILVIACVNFMNLATARSARRALEIGLRKVMGAGKKTLGIQFLTESMVIATVSVLFAAAVAYMLLPFFNNLTGKEMVIDFSSPKLWAVLAGISLITGFLSGSYPALLLPSFKISNSIKGAVKHSRSAVFVRKSLVVFQFGISILLIIGTIAVYRQLDFILSKNLGLDKENMIFINLEGETANRFETYKTELMKIPEVMSVTATSGNPLSYDRSSSGPTWRGKNPEINVEMNILSVGQDFLKTMKMDLASGRDFSINYSEDSANFLINEEAAKIMGFENPVNEDLSVWGVNGKIIGVVKNFHMTTLYHPIAPLVIRYDPKSTGVAFVRMRDNTQQAIEAIGKLTTAMNPAFPFNYNFLDEVYEQTYRSEQVIGSLAAMFAFIAIFISCLGLLGLSSFSAEQRTKEIGIRKVLGADVSGIIVLLSKDYSLLILMAFLSSAPLAWYFTEDWLNRFTFRTSLGVSDYIIAGLSTLALTAFTTGFKSFQAASADPVKSLRDE